MTAPSNANTSGLEVVAYLEVSKAGMGRRACLHQRKETPTMLRRWSSEPLVTAASAQARISELEADNLRLQSQVRMAVEAAQFEWSGGRHRLEARADRLAKALERAADDLRDIGTQKPQPTNSPDPEHENYLRRVLISLGQVGNARARAALQQETQP